MDDQGRHVYLRILSEVGVRTSSKDLLGVRIKTREVKWDVTISVLCIF